MTVACGGAAGRGSDEGSHRRGLEAPHRPDLDLGCAEPGGTTGSRPSVISDGRRIDEAPG